MDTNKGKDKPMTLTTGEILFYQAQDGVIRLEVKLQDETVWLTQRLMSDLYQISIPTINEHLSNIYKEGELELAATIRKFRIVQTEGNRQVERLVDHYNLEAILAVGYRVRSARGVQFRQWATSTLKEYVVKGFVLDDERLKNPGGWDYFDVLLERIRDIRTSEKRFYQKIRDIYSISIDYDAKSTTAQVFFKTVLNKMLWAITNKTAAELIVERANAESPNMGLTSWQSHRVRKSDVCTAKNYLIYEEILELNRIVTMFLDYAEDQAKRRQPITMRQWEERLDAFLSFNDRDVLLHSGSISHEQAENLAHERFEKYDERRRDSERIAAEDEYIHELESFGKEAAQDSLNLTVIRKANQIDIPMMQSFIFEHGKNPWNFLPEDVVKAHIAEIKNKKIQAYIAESNDECLGFACFYIGLPSTCQKYERKVSINVAYLSEIVVHRDYVGRGIGSKLINALKGYLIENKVKRLYAERHADNASSSGVMTKMGFKIVDEYIDEPRRSTGSRKTVVTRLEL